MPDTCPACGEPVAREEGEVAIFCANAACPAQVVRRIEHWASRGAMAIDGLGYKVALQLVRSGLLTDVADLYALGRDDLVALEGFGEKRADNLLSAIADSRNRPLRRVLTGLGVRGVGTTVARTLTSHYPSLDSLVAASLEELLEIEGIGPRIARDILGFLRRPRHRELVARLSRNGVSLRDEPVTDRGPAPLEGMTFVITGTLPTMSREAATALIQRYGGRVTGGVSTNTTRLLVGDKPGATKFSKAQRLGIPTIDEDGLIQMIGVTEDASEGDDAVDSTRPRQASQAM